MSRAGIFILVVMFSIGAMLAALADENGTIIDSSMQTSHTQSPVLEIIAKGFSKSDHGLALSGFIVENSDKTSTFGDSQYQTTAYDSSGAVLGTTSGMIPLIFPGQRSGLIDYMNIPKGAQIASLEVQLIQGEFIESNFNRDPLAVENTTYFEDEYASKATGIIRNLLDRKLENIKVYALAYSDRGDVIGGGISNVRFIPANGHSAVEVIVQSQERPTKVELYPELSGLADLNRIG